jgi:hypothetical protein
MDPVIFMAAFCGFIMGGSCVWCAFAHAAAYPKGRQHKDD